MTSPSPAELDRRTEAALAELRKENGRRGPPSRRWDDATRKRVSEGVLRYHARRVAADPDASPLKRARYEREWSLKTTATRAGLALNSVWAAEVRSYTQMLWMGLKMKAAYLPG